MNERPDDYADLLREARASRMPDELLQGASVHLEDARQARARWKAEADRQRRAWYLLAALALFLAAGVAVELWAAALIWHEAG